MDVVGGLEKSGAGEGVDEAREFEGENVWAGGSTAVVLAVLLVVVSAGGRGTDVDVDVDADSSSSSFKFCTSAGSSRCSKLSSWCC